MAEPSGDYASRLQEYKQRLENLLVDAQGAIDRQAPDALDKMAATARNIAQRLDDMARDARQRAAQKEATPQGPKPSEEPHPDEPRGDDAPPAPSGESGTAGT
jgi:hypothetical protein